MDTDEKDNIYITIVASWTRALHELWWCPRTSILQKEQRMAETEIRKEQDAEKDRKKAEKRAAKREERAAALKQLLADRETKRVEKLKRKAESEPLEIYPITKKQRKDITDKIKKLPTKKRKRETQTTTGTMKRKKHNTITDNWLGKPTKTTRNPADPPTPSSSAIAKLPPDKQNNRPTKNR